MEEGVAGTIIADFSQEKQIDLIMMPTHGYGRFRAFLLGSIIAKVLHDAHCPVWAHAEELSAPPAGRWKQIVCAIGTDPRDTSILKWAAEFAAGRNLTVCFIHSVEGVDTGVTKERDPRRWSCFKLCRVSDL